MEERDSSSNALQSAPAMRQAEARVGSVLRGKWRVERLLGVGGMGAVYAATHRNGRRCAIKVLLPFHGADRRAVQRFLKEGYVANELAHPGAVQIHDDDFTEDGLPFLVMELLEGRSLSAKLEEPPYRLETTEAIQIAVEILDVLAAAHARSIIHRDVKPDNVFLLHDGRVKLLDFGIARLRSVSTAGTTTANGSLLGTPATMAPEQARGRLEEIDARSDVFGVGATLFTMLSAKEMRTAATVNELLLVAMTEPVRPLRDVAPYIPPAVAAVVDRALAFGRDERWPTAEAMRAALLDVMGGFSSTEPRLLASDPVGHVSHGSHVRSSPPAQATVTAIQGFSVAASERPEAVSRSRRRPRMALAALGVGAVLVIASGTVLVVRGATRTAPDVPPAEAPSAIVATAPPSVTPSVDPTSSVAAAPPTASSARAYEAPAPSPPRKRAPVPASVSDAKSSVPPPVADPPKVDPLQRRL